ncbi:MAG TPA: hypothetical protein VIO94_06185, partial [Phenylobacterium sp.]
MRPLLAALAALLLSACNLVLSEQPLFTPADEDRSAPLRDGLWVRVKADCPFDPKAAPPECAQPGEVRNGRPIDPDSPAEDVVIAGGPVRVVQIKVTNKEGKTGPAVVYLYGALRPLRFDAQGRVVEAQNWIIQCGPPPPEPKPRNGKPPEPGDFLTLTPSEGMRVDRESGACWASDP